MAQRRLLHRSRLLIAALLLTASALSGTFARSALAAPADVRTTLALGLYGTEDALVGQHTSYTIVVQNVSPDTNANPLEYGIAFPRAVASIDAFSDSSATCAAYTTASAAGIFCEQDGLAYGAKVSLVVQITFVGPVNTGVISAQAKAANSDFVYGGKNVKVNHALATPTHPWGPLPLSPGLGVAAPAD